MLVDPINKTITLKLDQLGELVEALNGIEEIALGEGVDAEKSRIICLNLNAARDAMNLKRGVQRHEKWKENKD